MRTRAVAVVIDDGNVLVIDRIKNGRRYVVLPGGGVEAGEGPEEACLRELREETGLMGTIVIRLELKSVDPSEAVYFRVSVSSRALQLGWPEVERSGAANVYEPRWMGLGSLELLVPEAAHDAVRAALVADA